MVAIPASDDEKRVDDLLTEKITVQDFLTSIREALGQNVRQAVYALLPLTQKRSDYLYAVLCHGWDPNKAMTSSQAIQEMRALSRYKFPNRTFELAMQAINSDGDAKYDRTAFAIAKHWVTMLEKNEQGLEDDIEKVVDFTRKNPVAPTVPTELQMPRRNEGRSNA